MKVGRTTLRSVRTAASRAAFVSLVTLTLVASGASGGVSPAVAEGPFGFSPTDREGGPHSQSVLERLTSPLPFKGGVVNLAKMLEAEAAAEAAAQAAAREAAADAARERAQTRNPDGWRTARVSWYGPGFYGRGMAGGGKLERGSMVVAHKRLPFGTRVEFSYEGKTVIAPVQDRGPFVAGREFDLGPGVARALGMSGVITVRYRILGR